MNYREEKDISKKNKEEYLESIERLIEKRQQRSFEIRKEYAEGIFEKQDEYRQDLKKMLGWPLVEYDGDSGILCTACQKLSEEDGYSVWRMQFEVLEGIRISGLFFRQNSDEAKPLIIVQHGGWCTPEITAGFYGSTQNNNDMLQRVAGQGVHVFAPQLLLWKEDEYGVDFDRRKIDARLKRVGSSITAIEIYAIQKILDYFEEKSYVKSFGMIGLSYGGFYTLFTTAVETRIKSAVSCSFFNSRDVVGWADWVWQNSSEKFDDAEVACLIYPRKLFIRFGKHDHMFPSEHSVKAYERLCELCEKVGTEWVDYSLFDGDHEVFRDDEPIIKMIDEVKRRG